MQGTFHINIYVCTHMFHIYSEFLQQQRRKDENWKAFDSIMYGDCCLMIGLLYVGICLLVSTKNIV